MMRHGWGPAVEVHTLVCSSLTPSWGRVEKLQEYGCRRLKLVHWPNRLCCYHARAEDRSFRSTGEYQSSILVFGCDTLLNTIVRARHGLFLRGCLHAVLFRFHPDLGGVVGDIGAFACAFPLQKHSISVCLYTSLSPRGR